MIPYIEKTMLDAIKNHWPEYLIEAWCIGTFMISACLFGVALFHSASPAQAFSSEIRNVAMGTAMGATAVAIICSPWGKRSGAHFNPAVTLSFWRLGKIRTVDAFFYIMAHFAGGVLGVGISWLIMGNALSDTAVNFIVTVPGKFGVGTAFVAEAIISFVMMGVILIASNSLRYSRLTPYFAGLLVAIYISVESPVSGMSMNPARTFASAAVSGNWIGWWIYFVAPPTAMLAAAELYLRIQGKSSIFCAKLHHHNPARCIFNCRFGDLRRGPIEVTKNTHLFPTVTGLF